MAETRAPDHPEIREAVARLCAGFPGEYWRALDRDMRYPTEFVQALTEAGYLAVLIPEEYGGSGLGLSAAAAILEEVQRAGCNGAACHAQMYTMGTVLRHGSEDQKRRYLPEIAAGRLRLQAFGVTEPTSGTDTTALKTIAKREGDAYVVRGQKIWTSRALRPHAAACAHHAGGSGHEADGGAVGLSGRHARGGWARAHDPADPHHDEPRHDRGVLRRPARAGRKLDRRGGQGLPLHPLGHECGAHPDRGRIRRRRQVVHRQGRELRQGAGRVRTPDRPEPGHPVSGRQG